MGAPSLLLVATALPAWTLVPIPAYRGNVPARSMHDICTRYPATQAQATATVEWTDLDANAQKLSDSQLARTVISATDVATMVTRMSSKDAASFPDSVAFAVDTLGYPMFTLREGQTQISVNLQACADCSFFAQSDALPGSSMALIGTAETASVEDINEDQLDRVAAALGTTAEVLATRDWLRLVPTRVHFSNQLQQSEAWISPEDYSEAKPDLIAAQSHELVPKLNGKHADSLKKFAAVYCDHPEEKMRSCEVVSIDRLGFDISLKATDFNGGEGKLMRVGFAMPAETLEDATSVFMKLFQEAFERQNGYM